MPINRTALPLSSAVCGGEYLTVERLLLGVPGVGTALVNPASEMAYVEYDPGLTDPDALFAVLKQAGFTPAGEARVSHREIVPPQGAS